MSDDKWDKLRAIQIKVFQQVMHENIQQKYVLLLATRVMELSQDAYFLCCVNRVSSVPVLMRSALESYVDLQCVKNDEGYVQEMNQSVQCYMDELQGGKYVRNPSVWGRFKKAGEKHRYRFYTSLCRSTHGNLESLIRDHTINGEVSLGHEHCADDIRLYKNQLVEISVSALIAAFAFIGFKGPLLNELQTIHSEAASGKYA
ncbi:DUF5677 domain-containing protein [Vibrio vulnificus]|uniref:DUF5677 domain-containing protein n=1 Tax=Vibrio vulnificus TaxID=672 RepID=UPI0040588523